MKNLSFALLMLGLATALGGCAPLLVGAAVGGAVGYEAKSHGYTVQSPITKESKGTTQ